MESTLFFIESESVNTGWPPPDLNFGGVLEDKNGELCLRLADQITKQLENDGWTVTRTWLRPFDRPFDRELYRKVT